MKRDILLNMDGKQNLQASPVKEDTVLINGHY